MYRLGDDYMPQISLYLDENIHKEISKRAKLNKTSISKFVVTTLKAHLSKNWPEGFKNTFGSISDDSFIRQDTPDWSMDVPRESL